MDFCEMTEVVEMKMRFFTGRQSEMVRGRRGFGKKKGTDRNSNKK